MRIAATVRSAKRVTPEAQLTRQVVDYMNARGWRAIRMQSGVYQGPATTFRSGEKGMPDYLFLRPVDQINGFAVLWVEFKSKRGRLSQWQENWIARERLFRFPVWVVSDLDNFQARYAEDYGWLHR